MKENKFVLFLIYLICSIGCAWHTYHIFHLVVSEELIATEHYELTKEVQMPVMIFCLKIKTSLIDPNRKLTGAYLEELTRELTAERTFNNVTYLDEFDDWTTFALNRVDRFFVLSMKCFRIKIDQVYHRDRFHFSNETQVLRLNFTDTANEEKHYLERYVYFITKTKETKNFNKIVILGTSRYTVTQETTLYRYKDRFSFIKSHFYSLKEDLGLNEQLLELQDNEHNLKTLDLPVQEKDFKFELQEDLFQQLHWTQRNQKPTNLNYQQVFTTNHLRFSQSESDFSYKLLFLQRIIFSTNEENFGKLILSLLNVLVIWFDLGVLDLHPAFPLFHNHLLVYLYLHLPVFLIDKMNKILIKLKMAKETQIAAVHSTQTLETELPATLSILD